MPNPPEPQAPSRNKYQLIGIPDGPEGIRATLELMRQLVRASRYSQQIRELALDITRPTGDANQKNYFGEAAALQAWVRDNIKYVNDVNEVETISPPAEVLRLGAGDCDDKAILLASLLESIGHPARFVALSFSPDVFEHVLVETQIGRGWLPLETTEDVPPGWYPPDVVQRLPRHI